MYPACSSTPVSVVDQLGILIEQPDVTDYVLGYDMGFGGAIAELRITALLGTGVCTVKINSVAVTGLTNVAITAGTRARFQATNLNIFPPGSDLTLTINSGSGLLANVRGSIIITR